MNGGLISVSNGMKWIGIFCGLGFLPLRGAVDAWDLPPVVYSDTPSRDRFAALVEKWSADPAEWRGKSPLERMRSVLAALHVPEASQILVFSKTSKQNSRIDPENPRALYFSPDCYCGYVPGGMMEIVIESPQLGPVYYVLDLVGAGTPLRAERDTNGCLTCHATGRTENVPGVLVRSVFPDPQGNPIFSLGTALIDHQSPIAERWGGYYVTGKISLPHLGNRTFREGIPAEPLVTERADLVDLLDTSKYACATSDIVALMVLEHQCQLHNLLTAAALNYRRAYYLGKFLAPDSDPDQGSAGQLADSAAAHVVEALLFTGEAALGEDGVEGSVAFQQQFAAQFPRTPDGDSLADFQLNTRLFKFRCSTMVYSAAFRGLPARVKSAVVAGLKKVLESEVTAGPYESMKAPERRHISSILQQSGVW